MNTSEIIQGSPQWHALRAGKATASRMDAVLAMGRNGAPSAARATYMGQLIAERLTGAIAASYTNAAMEHGTATEAEARAAYEFYTGRVVTEVGFVDHPRIAHSGASPDGLVDGVGLVEIKCPNSATHIETLLGSSVAGKYRLQMMWQMACTDSAWCDLVSYDPRMPEHMRLHVKRVMRDDTEIKAMELAVMLFLQELAGIVEALQDAYPEPAAFMAATS